MMLRIAKNEMKTAMGYQTKVGKLWWSTKLSLFQDKTKSFRLFKKIFRYKNIWTWTGNNFYRLDSVSGIKQLLNFIPKWLSMCVIS